MFVVVLLFLIFLILKSFCSFLLFRFLWMFSIYYSFFFLFYYSCYFLGFLKSSNLLLIVGAILICSDCNYFSCLRSWFSHPCRCFSHFPHFRCAFICYSFFSFSSVVLLFLCVVSQRFGVLKGRRPFSTRLYFCVAKRIRLHRALFYHSVCRISIAHIGRCFKPFEADVFWCVQALFGFGFCSGFC